MGTRKRGEPLGPRGWLAALERGMLVVASNAAAKKFHLVRLHARGDSYDSRHGKPYESRFGRGNDGERWDFSEVWNGRSLCGGGSSRSTYGNRSTYYWQPRPDPIASYDLDEDLCNACCREFRREHKGQDLATVVTTRQLGESAWELPFGWRAVEVSPHPFDVSADDDPTTVTNKAGEVVGVRREEIARWVRGIRVVRLCKLFDEPGRYSVNIHSVDDEQHDEWKLKADRPSCMQKAHEIMARGGR